jgi:hypothetical protein
MSDDLIKLTEKAQNIVMDAYNSGKQDGVDETVDEWDADKERHAEEVENIQEAMSQQERQMFIDGFNYALQQFDHLFTATNGRKVLETLEEYSRMQLELWKITTIHDDRKTSPPPVYEKRKL